MERQWDGRQEGRKVGVWASFWNQLPKVLLSWGLFAKILPQGLSITMLSLFFSAPEIFLHPGERKNELKVQFLLKNGQGQLERWEWVLRQTNFKKDTVRIWGRIPRQPTRPVQRPMSFCQPGLLPDNEGARNGSEKSMSVVLSHWGFQDVSYCRTS